MTLAFLGELAGLGFAGAFVAGLVGVGGAILMIPLLYYVPPWIGLGQLAIKQVAAVTLGQVFAASLMGAIVHGGAALVHRPLAVAAGAAMATTALAGALVSRLVPDRMLLGVLGTMGIAALLLMLLPPPPGSEDAIARDVRVQLGSALVYPGAIGFLSGMVGAGGAFLLLPVLVGVMRVPARVAIGTSLAITLVSAFSGFVGKLLTGQVPLWPTVAVVAGSLGGAAMGARMSRRTPVGVLRAVLAVTIAAATLRIWADVILP
ncbi:MAG TPA: sulfite exporter TauE/SafE family protein [Methylomirabilota bacterium]|jgi:uncharacterized membrane protein YfcA|nr:sulfite exporter TauE/SafE family protein [Methylomirabilota bacterium]